MREYGLVSTPAPFTPAAAAKTPLVQVPFTPAAAAKTPLGPVVEHAEAPLVQKLEEREQAAVATAVGAAADVEDLQSVKEEEWNAKSLEDAAAELTLYPVEIVAAGVVEIESSSGSDSESSSTDSDSSTSSTIVQAQGPQMVEHVPEGFDYYRHVKSGLVHSCVEGQDVSTCKTQIGVNFKKLGKKIYETGLGQGLIDSLKRHGIKTLAQLAFAVGQPGQPIADVNIEQLVQQAHGRAPQLTETAILKRVAFEAQTYLTATLRQAVDRTDDTPRRIPFAERTTRLEALKTTLGGIGISGEHEPAHGLLDKACAMFESNTVKYLELASCVSRAHEVQGAPKSKELTLEKGSLVLKHSEDKMTSPTDSEIKVHYAMVRRGISFQFARLMSFEQHSTWETFLFEALHREAPPGYSRPSLAQLLQCDKAAFARLGSQVSSVRQKDDGTYPLGEALLALRQDPNIALYLMPVAKSSSSTVASSSGGAAAYSTARPHPYSGNRPKGGGKGKKGGSKSTPPIPAELRGKWHKNSSGEPICYGYNCKSGCPEKGVKPGGRCSKGLHICAEPRCGGNHSLQEHGSK
eukprot:s3652_g5.t1